MNARERASIRALRACAAALAVSTVLLIGLQLVGLDRDGTPVAWRDFLRGVACGAAITMIFMLAITRWQYREPPAP